MNPQILHLSMNCNPSDTDFILIANVVGGGRVGKFVLCGHFDYNKPMFQDKKYFGPRGGWPIFKPPVSGGFREKKIYGDNFMVQHNPNNHFQAVNAKTHFGTPP